MIITPRHPILTVVSWTFAAIALLAAGGLFVCLIPFPGHLQAMDIAGCTMAGAASIAAITAVPAFVTSAGR